MAMSFDANSISHVNTAAPPQVTAPEPPKQIAAPPSAPSPELVSPQIEDFDAFVKGEVQAFVDLGQKIGDFVAEQVRR